MVMDLRCACQKHFSPTDPISTVLNVLLKINAAGWVNTQKNQIIKELHYIIKFIKKYRYSTVNLNGGKQNTS
jgi:hypothetical protein